MPSPTPLPRELTICLAKEPLNLFVFFPGQVFPAPLFSAIYGSQPTASNLNIPSILEAQPGVPESAARFEAASVLPGEPIVDASGSSNVLAKKVRYRPAGCHAGDCALEYTGDQAVQMDVWTLTFQLKAGLHWSDGAALTASDSLYSFELAKALRAGTYSRTLERTLSYTALDERTVEWRGLPGFKDSDPGGKFFMPLPRHAWGAQAPADISIDAGDAANLPTFGPFKVRSWNPGSELILERNPNYFQASEGLPHFDRLAFRWFAPGENAQQALLAGHCDLLDFSEIPSSQFSSYRKLQQASKVKLAVRPASWEALYFNVQPFDSKQPNLLGQAEVRQAIALCSGRSDLALRMFGGLALPADGLGFTAQVSGTAQTDPAAGSALLDKAGWLDLDHNPATPRTAQSAPGIPAGTPLQLTLLTSADADRQASADALRDNLAVCGIGVTVDTRPVEEYLAPGPDGPVFGRKFSLALLAWSAPSGEAPCSLFTSLEVPAPYPQGALDWGGANAAGYASPVFDQTCQAYEEATAGTEASQQARQQLETLFSQDLPALPLYWQPRLAAARSDFCGLRVEPAAGDLWANLPIFDLGEACRAP